MIPVPSGVRVWFATGGQSQTRGTVDILIAVVDGLTGFRHNRSSSLAPTRSKKASHRTAQPARRRHAPDRQFRPARQQPPR